MVRNSSAYCVASYLVKIKHKYVLEKLGSTNYASWSTRFRSFLTARRLAIWLTVDVEPRMSAEDLESASIALAFIRMYVDDRWLRVLAPCVSAVEAWELLAASHLAALQPLSTNLQSKLFAIKMRAGETVDEFFNRVEEAQDDLARLGMPLPESTVVGVVIRGLSPAFAASSVSLTIQAATYTLITLRAALVAVESLLERPAKSFRVDGASGSRPPRRSEPTCHHCGQKGHIRPVCKLWVDARAWQTAIDDELASLMQHNCWTLVPLPPGARAVGSRLILERKRDLRYKARLVAQGFSQRAGIDYDDTYAPVSGYTTLRSFLAVVAAQDLEMRQLDIKTAFLNGELEEVVYMRQPQGYSIGPSNLVCRLHKAIYGLKQAPRAWHLTLKQKLLDHGFVTSDADPHCSSCPFRAGSM